MVTTWASLVPGVKRTEATVISGSFTPTRSRPIGAPLRKADRCSGMTCQPGVIPRMGTSVAKWKKKKTNSKNKKPDHNKKGRTGLFPADHNSFSLFPTQPPYFIQHIMMTNPSSTPGWLMHMASWWNQRSMRRSKHCRWRRSISFICTPLDYSTPFEETIRLVDELNREGRRIRIILWTDTFFSFLLHLLIP